VYSRRAQRAVGKLNDVTVMSSPQSPSLTEGSSVIRVAIVSEPETTVLADSLEALLDRAKGFTFSRFEYRVESDLKPRPAGLANPDVVVATLGMTAHDLGVEIDRKVFHGLTQSDLNSGSGRGAVRASVSANLLVRATLQDFYDPYASPKPTPIGGTTSESAQVPYSRSTQASNQRR
jgi:hypothetical protein